MKSSFFLYKCLFVIGCVCVIFSVSAQSTVSTAQDILTRITKESNPRESLIQRYYAIDDLLVTVRQQAPNSVSVIKLEAIKTSLRKEIDTKKSLLTTSNGASTLLSTYRSGVLTKDKAIENPCPQFDEIVTDRSYALDLPPSLVMATWLMESGCGWYRPANGDGIFQIVSKDYGTGVMTTGHWIWMMYDFNDFIRAKFARYQKANNLTVGLPFNYQHIDYDSVVQFGALYNGLSGASVKGTILPAAPNYVFGKLNAQYSGASKDGLLVRVMKVLNYMN